MNESTNELNGGIMECSVWKLTYMVKVELVHNLSLLINELLVSGLVDQAEQLRWNDEVS